MSTYEVLTLMLSLAMFVLTLISLLIVLIKEIKKGKK